MLTNLFLLIFWDIAGLSLEHTENSKTVMGMLVVYIDGGADVSEGHDGGASGNDDDDGDGADVASGGCANISVVVQS